MDGPDGFDYYYHHVKKEELTKLRREMGGGSTMIWVGIGYDGKTDIVFIEGRMNAAVYRKLIRKQIGKYAVHIVGSNFIFQQDNAAVVHFEF